MPGYLRVILLSAAVLLAVMPASALAVSSANFYKQGGEIFDDWDLCRTRGDGEDGFFQVYSETEFYPVILNESLGANADRAYEMGQQFAREYPDIYQRAEEVFAFARDRVRYTPDASQFGFGEFAQNADEMASAIDDEGFAHGDCEDYAALIAVMCQGAGLRSAIVLTPDHAAVLVYLPEYSRANRFLTLDGESGWVWAEATGGNNPLGWMPETYMGVELGACEVEDVGLAAVEPPDKPTTVVAQGAGGSPGFQISPFFWVIGVMWLLSFSRRRRVKRRA